MALQASGPISIGNINTEFGFAATTPRSLSQLYRNGGIVGAGAPNVPTSGPISLSQFYGAANQFIYTISSNQTNLNLRTGAIAAGWDQNAPLVVTINSGVYVSSNSTGTPALTINGSFPGGVSLTNNGFVVGMGGAGGKGADGSSNNGVAGGTGGLALSASVAVSITNNGTIAGGGGGGGGGGGASAAVGDGKGGTIWAASVGGSGGGGGRSGATNSGGGAAGATSGAVWGALAGGAGTSGAAGNGGNQTGDGNPYGGGWAWYTSFNPSVYGRRGGNGGGWGAAGSAALAGVIAAGTGLTSSGGGAGAAGAAVSGNANITWVATGTRLGAIA